MHKVIAVVPLLFLVGCGPGTKLGSIAGGECNLPGVHTPTYKVLGKTQYDQNWADDTTEGLVRGCNQPRPLARPTSLDTPKVKKQSKPVAKAITHVVPSPPPKPPIVAAPIPLAPPVGNYEPPSTPTPPPPVQKKHWWQR